MSQIFSDMQMVWLSKYEQFYYKNLLDLSVKTIKECTTYLLRVLCFSNSSQNKAKNNDKQYRYSQINNLPLGFL